MSITGLEARVAGLWPRLTALEDSLGGGPVVPPVDPPVGLWANEPGDYSLISDRPVAMLDENLWNDSGPTVVTEGSEPFSPRRSLKFTYDNIGGGGDNPGYTSFQISVTELYVGFYFKLSDPWNEHVSGTSPKLFYVKDSRTGGPGDPFYLQRIWQRSGHDAQFSGSIQNSGNPRNRGCGQNLNAMNIGINTWYRGEMVLKTNSPKRAIGDAPRPGENRADGEYRLWVNGTKVAAHTDIWFSDAATPGWTTFYCEPIWGGQGDALPSKQYLWYDHIRLSGK